MTTLSSILRNNFKGDKVVWRIVFILCLMSILVVYSSTPNLVVKSGKGIMYFLLNQIFFTILSLALVYVVHNIPVNRYRQFATVGLVFIIGLLVVTLFYTKGASENVGANRWIEIPFLGISIQSSDIAKLGLLIYLAKVLEKNKLDTFGQFFWKIIMPIGLVCVLVFQGNFSTSAIIGLTAFCVLFIACVRGWYLTLFAGTAILGFVVLMIIGLNYPKVFPRAHAVVERIGLFIGDDIDRPLTDEEKIKLKNKSFQPEQAKITVAAGGLFGKGPGNSTQRYVLPEAYSDYVYAFIAEEYGFFGALGFLMMYLWLFYRSVLIAKKCSRVFPMMLVLGLTLLIVFQAMVHMSVAVGLIPVTGQTLPLVSKGGTSMVFMSIACGIILSVSRAVEKKETEQLNEVPPAEPVVN